VDSARIGIWLDESYAKMVAVEQLAEGAPSMGKPITDLSSVTTIGLDLAKHVFQIHGVDACGGVIISKALRRKDVLVFFAQLPPCLVGLEACGAAHHWARELIKLGHDVRIMPAAYVKPYVRRQKNDAADAAGICEAVARPSMRFISVRTLENQAALMHHKTREMLVAQRTQLINALRGHLAEIGVIAAQGLRNARALAGLIETEDDETIPACVRRALAPLVHQLRALDQEIACSDRTIAVMARGHEAARRLMTIPGSSERRAASAPVSLFRLPQLSPHGNIDARRFETVDARTADQMPLNIECVVDRRMNRNEALSRFGRFEALHLSFSSSNRLMRVLRTVVGTHSLLMPSGETNFAKCRSIRPATSASARPRARQARRRAR
jgi:transposase